MEPPHEMVIEHEPLRVSFLRDSVVQMVLNDNALLHMEHFRAKPEQFPRVKEEGETGDEPFEERLTELRKAHRLKQLRTKKPSAAALEQWARFEQEDGGEWEESWRGSRDSKPKGPEGLSLDITFPGYDTLYGLPEHASPMSLRSTRAPPGGEAEEEGRFHDPYRLMNTDVFEYEHDSPMSLYGSSPILHAQSRGSSVSVLWLNSAETWVDLYKTKSRAHTSKVARDASAEDPVSLRGGTSSTSSHAHFFSESGILDLWVFLGPSATRNMERFTSLVGRTALPQYFAIGYHQCRWNYLTDKDVKDVSARFDTADVRAQAYGECSPQIPMDVMWLDIEYTKQKMYGVWDPVTFPDPEGMLDALDRRGRKVCDAPR